MSKDIRKWSDGRYTLMFDEHTFFVWDNENDERMTALNVTKKLNEQQATIKKLQDLCGESDGENAKLRIENKEQQATIEHLTKSRDKWRELSNSFSFYCKCYEKAIERAFEEKPYPTEDDINRIYAELEKELDDE